MSFFKSIYGAQAQATNCFNQLLPTEDGWNEGAPPEDGRRFLAWYPDGRVEIIHRAWVNETGHSYSQPLRWRELPR